MALKTCPHCGHSVSDQATKCPSCGKDPRYTDFQLDQQEQQHKKKRKMRRKTAVIIAVVAVACAAVLICLCAGRNMLRYKKGLAYRAVKDYEAAVDVFNSLGSYRDSDQMARLSMRDYIYAHPTSNDPISVKYADQLIEDGYGGELERILPRYFEQRQRTTTSLPSDAPRGTITHSS